MSWGSLWGFLWGSSSELGEDGFLTSGSWTYEGIYKFPTLTEISTTQSLVRLCVSGSSEPSLTSGFVLNCLAISGSSSSDTRLELFARPSISTGSAPVLHLSLSGSTIFDGDKWHVSFGRFRADDPSDYLPEGVTKSDVSSSYFLRLGKSDRFGIIKDKFITSSFFLEDETADNIVWTNEDSNFNISGSYIAIGSQSFAFSSASFLNDTGSVGPVARVTDFDGKVSGIRFWSKGLLQSEWEEHVRNFKSLGVKTPLENFNFVAGETGSYGRLRLDASGDQVVTASNSSGEITFYDFSQNEIFLTGSGFEANSLVVKPETFYYSYISPKFDQASTANKVRARAFQDFDIAQEHNAKFGFIHEIPANEEPMDDTRFTIDFSIIDALDQDMINIFSTLDALDNIIGDPELQFSPDYPQLENLREIYFNRLDQKINLKSFFEFFKWFDRSIGDFISALLPRKTRFRGVNFVVESHMLERPKFENLNVDQYLNAATERSSLKGTILLQQIVGAMKKY